MFPFGPRLNTVFASRWKALVWAGCIVLTAYCTVPSAEETARADAEREAEAARAVHTNPWALDGK
jgi:hypothetical protein